MTDEIFSTEELSAQLEAARQLAQKEYAQLLWDGKYDEAMDKLGQIDVIELHIACVGEL